MFTSGLYSLPALRLGASSEPVFLLVKKGIRIGLFLFLLKNRFILDSGEELLRYRRCVGQCLVLGRYSVFFKPLPALFSNAFLCFPIVFPFGNFNCCMIFHAMDML